MMDVAFVGVSQMFFLLFGFGGMGLPLGVPPGPEDPLLAHVAPQECLFYTSWAGMAEPDPKSTNQTELLMAEPEVRRFIGEVERQVRKAVHQAAEKEGPQSAALADDAVLWVRTLLTHPTAIFLASAKMSPTGPDVRAGLVVNLGGDAAKIRASLEKHQKGLPVAAEAVEMEGGTWYRLRPAPGIPPITWGTKGKYLMVGMGEGAVEDILQRARDQKTPEWLAEIGKQLPVERRSTVSYVNVKAIADLLLPLAPPQVRQVVQSLGLGNVTSLTAVTGLDRTGFAGHTLIGLDGEPAGLLSLVAAKPLKANDLAPLPRDATIAAAARFDADRALETIQSIVSGIDARAGEDFAREIGAIQEQLGIDLRKDLLKPLGDVWCLYNSPDEGGVVVTGLTLVVQVRDPERLAQTHAKLLREAQAALRDQDPRSRHGAAIIESEAAGRKLWYLRVNDEDFPLAPAWCLTDKELVVALFPQNVKAYLTRGSDYHSLAEAKGVDRLLEGDSGPAKLVYQDMPALFDLAYPLVQIGGKYLAAEAAREGFDLDLALLPSAPAIRRHLRPGVTIVRRTPAGIEIDTRQTIPGGNLGTTIPVGAALLVPATFAARDAARRAQSMNNLKQIGLAMHNHADTFRQFPAAYTTDKQGKPLLSWRVKILPFVEAVDLYNQFHLDEPWDSQHNKQLIARMPLAYRSPNSHAGPGKTTYLAVRGRQMIFPGEKPIGFADITDGTSNTIMVVEANDQSAVIWTKPDDFEPKEENPSKGLVGPRGGFNALFADGSVRSIRAAVDPKMLWALFTRNGGEVINYDALDNPRSRRTPPKTTVRPATK